MKFIRPMMTVVLLSTPAFSAEPGTITIPIAQQGSSDIMRPHRGMLMTEVEKKFGIPTQIVGPIGQPPITRWVYENYTVIFEQEHVVHTVLKMIVPLSEQPVDYPAETQATTPENTK